MDIESKILRKITRSVPRASICPVVPEAAKYFHLKSKDKHVYISDRLEYMKQPFLDLLEIKEFLPVDFRSQDPFYAYGIVSSSNGDKINEECYLFNPADGSKAPAKLNLSFLDGYSIFNGQIVAIRGTNADGHQMSVQRIYGLPIVNINTAQRAHISVSVLKGPFSPKDIENMLACGCDSLVLFGPFCSFSGHSFSYIDQFISCVEMSMRTRPDLKVVLVPSAEDYCSVSIFPQPAHKVVSDRIVSLPNPSYFYLNNHLIAVSNFDGYIDMCSEELFKEPSDSTDFLLKTDKATRLSYHLVFQRSFVPVLYSKSDVAYGNWLNMNIAPDLYIICSKMRQFHREVGPSTVLNTGNSSGMRCMILSQGCEAKYSVDFSTYSE